jgi:hypothetical protein
MITGSITVSPRVIPSSHMPSAQAAPPGSAHGELIAARLNLKWHDRFAADIQSIENPPDRCSS